MSHGGPNWAYNYQPSPAEFQAAWASKQDWNATLDTIIAQGGAPAQVSGAWTPNDQSGPGLTLTVSASYTRIGNMVFAYAQITYPVTVDVDNAKIGGLPVPVPPQLYSKGPFAVGNTGGLTIWAYPQPSSQTFTFATPTGTALTNAQLSGLTLDLCLTYAAT